MTLALCLALFLFILLRALWNRRIIKGMTTQRCITTGARHGRHAHAVGAGLHGGRSLGRLGYLEVIYMIVMLMELLRVHVARALAAAAGEAAALGRRGNT